MSGRALSAMFDAAREQGRPVFMPFMTAGIPSEDQSLDVFRQLAADGADAFELGIPYSDPLMDGEVIQAASSHALAGGMTFLGGLDLAGRVATSTGKPVIVMTYVNPILQAGPEVFAAEAAALGISGVIIADVPYEEAVAIKAALDEHGIGLALFVAPTTDEERLRAIAAAQPSFIYAVADMGVTGRREDVSSHLQGLVRRIRTITSVPIVLGVGISTPEQAATAAGLADGVIVGSALVAEVLETGRPASAAAFADAVHAAGR
ncbi:MAG: tryptophan synthase subunit alpha [Acidimicrobiia bacterium]|nr:tryptophan synthase subunit alpha [Acidimicrobiia bacterium]MBT8194434.1 tryptophan synthase subunit alpha [Acidimicrobiia bacterium]MBT8248437.1 tryptophan synthase subunit alpha [Acidimicrobiia bacterium]NNF88516.1 tryptophan synthase subunit alpha [Acidimicrobiia bacterium]NNJ47513.1 tryptophan synthase subunit alpha [Acidimicrobiia bacterium]